jgi:hypothetical protein
MGLLLAFAFVLYVSRAAYDQFPSQPKVIGGVLTLTVIAFIAGPSMNVSDEYHYDRRYEEESGDDATQRLLRNLVLYGLAAYLGTAWAQHRERKYEEEMRQLDARSREREQNE